MAASEKFSRNKFWKLLETLHRSNISSDLIGALLTVRLFFNREFEIHQVSASKNRKPGKILIYLVQKSAGKYRLVTFAGEVLKEKLHFLCCVLFYKYNVVEAQPRPANI